MFGLGEPKLPVTKEQQLWIDKSFVRLGKLLGYDRLLKATVVLPTAEHFPDRYDGSEVALRHMLDRVAAAMEVDSEDLDLTIFNSEHDVTRQLVPFFSGESLDADGLYHHDPKARPHISVNKSQLKEPMSLIAVLAYELCHVILLRPGLVECEEEDMEQLNDLLTVFLGFGVFTANSAFQFLQYTNNDSQGWCIKKLGYLTEEQFGYALARFTHERGENKPAWASFLSTNIAAYMKRSIAWLNNSQTPRLFQ